MKISSKILFAVSLLLGSVSVSAQHGAYGGYSPYSVYGIGEIEKQGSAYNKSMGGVGIASRNKRFLNYVNPAAVTARDTLSFFCDFGITQNNDIYNQKVGDTKLTSGNNTFNMANFAISFPIYKSLAFQFGLTPYSNVGFDFSTVEISDYSLISKAGNIAYQAYGYGGMYEFFAGAGFKPFKNLSVGAELIYYFGDIHKINNTVYSDDAFRTINGGYNLQLHAPTAKLGVQYEQDLGSSVTMVLGATYKFRTAMNGYSTDYTFAIASELSDTLKFNVDTLKKSKDIVFGDELGVGISFRGSDRWSVEFDYVRSNWKNSGIDNTKGFGVTGISGKTFSSTVSQSFRAGFEFVPNRNDIRYYFKRCSYRAGIYYDQSYYKLDGNIVSSKGITFGVTLPVFRFYNGITLGVDLGQKGSLKNGMIRERYATFNIGFNIHDIWFEKQRYQ